MSVRVSVHFGIVIRKRALSRLAIHREDVHLLMQASEPYDEDTELISFGPHLGEEASDEFIRRLKHAGLEYVDDFFVFSGDVPEWCGISCFVADES